MFTGIVKEIGTIKSVRSISEGIELEVYSNSLIGDMQIDDSVAINGVCQTIVSKADNYFKVQAVRSTLEKTNFSTLRVNQRVNLELALTPSTRMGGHFVQGHVNCVGTVTNVLKTSRNIQIFIKTIKDQFKYIVKEGSITVNGISLTVVDVDYSANTFVLSIIPHTVDQTTLEAVAIGEKVNIEVDILAKYMENLLSHNSKKNEAYLKEWLMD